MDETYYVSKGGVVPVKWTAPEVSFPYFGVNITDYFVHSRSEASN